VSWSVTRSSTALRRAHERAHADGFDGTDDASLVERIGGTVLMVEGPRWNIKVTLPEDLAVVESLIAQREGSVDG
jgi:2-C-methyl-D-erythritol 4-phosphate cytidylyltransferase